MSVVLVQKAGRLAGHDSIKKETRCCRAHANVMRAVRVRIIGGKAPLRKAL